MSDPFRLAELLIARAFHDIGGLAGTLISTLELAREEGETPTENLTAALEVATELGRRVRLLQAAWGPTGAQLDLDGLHALAFGVPADRRVRLDTSALSPGRVFTPRLGRMLLNIALLSAECLPRGGTLALAEAGDGALVATIAGRGAAWPDGFAAALADETVAWASLTGPRTLVAPLVALLARELNVRLSLMTARPRRRGPRPLLIAPEHAGETS